MKKISRIKINAARAHAWASDTKKLTPPALTLGLLIRKYMSPEIYNQVEPIAYLITVRCYGSWLHGDDLNSVDRHGYNTYGKDFVPPSEKLLEYMKKEMKGNEVRLDKPMRISVLRTIKEVCKYRGYELFAVQIRSNHFHAVVSAAENPDHIAKTFKSYATRNLRTSNLVSNTSKVWSRGQSCRYIWNQEQLEKAKNYVVYRQGDEITF